MSNANDRQVGGTHWISEYQHWDLVRDLGLDYYQGCATKYITRYKKKGGVEDLEKAKHYIDKVADCGSSAPQTVRSTTLVNLIHFMDANQLSQQQFAAIAFIATRHWSMAYEAIDALIENEARLTPKNPDAEMRDSWHS